MDDIYIYRVKLPPKHREAVMTCNGGYTVYIDIDLDEHEALRAYHHALRHIRRGDCDPAGGDVQGSEAAAHGS